MIVNLSIGSSLIEPPDVFWIGLLLFAGVDLAESAFSLPGSRPIEMASSIFLSGSLFCLQTLFKLFHVFVNYVEQTP